MRYGDEFGRYDRGFGRSWRPWGGRFGGAAGLYGQGYGPRFWGSERGGDRQDAPRGVRRGRYMTQRDMGPGLDEYYSGTYRGSGPIGQSPEPGGLIRPERTGRRGRGYGRNR
ncbi:MAG TPA: hypothetical protein VFL93_15325 [Longimicrobiaceae bacterium]|nr:hypothetical protein [Longimicrobiaceae bacterium]